MKESAEIAYSYVSANLQQFGGDPRLPTRLLCTCTSLKGDAQKMALARV